MLHKRITLLTRRSGTSVSEFRRHWAGPHAELVVRLPGVRSYVQNHIVESLASDGFGSPIDGIVELWFESDDSSVGIARHHSPEQLEDEIGFLESLVAIQSTDTEAGTWSDYAVQLLVWPVIGAEPAQRIDALAGTIASSPGSDATLHVDVRDPTAAPVRRTALPLELPVPEALLTVTASGENTAQAVLDTLAERMDAAGIAGVSLHRVERAGVFP